MELNLFKNEQIIATGQLTNRIACAEISGNEDLSPSKDSDSPWHYLMIIDRGSATFEVDGTARKAGVKNLVSIPVNSRLSHIKYSNSFHAWCLAVSINTLIEFFRRESYFPGELRRHFRDFMIYADVDNYKTIARDCRELIVRLGEESHQFRQDLGYAYLCIIMADIAQFMSKSQQTDDLPNNTVRGEEILVKFMRLAAKNIEEEFRIEWYADKLCLSVSYLSSIVKNQTGKPAGYVLSAVRLEHAIRYIKHNSMSMREIAERMHFPDGAAFSKFFKRHVGKTPHEYRTMTDK